MYPPDVPAPFRTSGCSGMTVCQFLDVELGTARAFRQDEEEELLVLRRPGADVAQGVFPVFPDERVLLLRVAELVVKNFLIFILALELFPGGGLIVAAVVEAVALPGRTRELDPQDPVGELLFRGDLHDPELGPVGTGLAAR